MHISCNDDLKQKTFLETNGELGTQILLVQQLIDLGYIARHTAKVSRPQADQPKWFAYLLHSCDKEKEITIPDSIYTCSSCNWKGYNVLSNGKTIRLSFSRRSDGVQLELKIHSIVLSKSKATLYLYFSKDDRFNYGQISHLRKYASKYKLIDNRLMRIDNFYQNITVKGISPNKTTPDYPHIILFLI